ncbi:hypothetical protein QR680_011652 [Steinernema hermaphroditum]|uniref:Uncharacterized protein n=1 Tax=Steinernema hermaphroditum TaxID=289476 RepID=A0AA39LZB5_9BILA|nr:hypothetical protein QR680_011652 [Steinernema hermaphroditum]
MPNSYKEALGRLKDLPIAPENASDETHEACGSLPRTVHTMAALGEGHSDDEDEDDNVSSSNGNRSNMP